MLTAKDPALLAQFRKSNDDVVRELTAYEKFLRDQLLPKSTGEFQIGAENFRQLAEQNRIRKVPVLAARGKLFDRDNRLLVTVAEPVSELCAI